MLALCCSCLLHTWCYQDCWLKSGSWEDTLWDTRHQAFTSCYLQT